MAQGDFLLFHEFSREIQTLHDLDTDAIKLALIVTLPLVGDADPSLGDYSEVPAGGSYVAGGAALANVTNTRAGNTTPFDNTADIVWAQNAASPSTARYALLYNSTPANNDAIGWFDLGGVIDLKLGPLTVQFNVGGILTVAAPA